MTRADQIKQVMKFIEILRGFKVLSNEPLMGFEGNVFMAYMHLNKAIAALGTNTTSKE